MMWLIHKHGYQIVTKKKTYCIALNLYCIALVIKHISKIFQVWKLPEKEICQFLTIFGDVYIPIAKPATPCVNLIFCLPENKGADQLRSNCKADQHLCFLHGQNNSSTF